MQNHCQNSLKLKITFSKIDLSSINNKCEKYKLPSSTKLINVFIEKSKMMMD